MVVFHVCYDLRYFGYVDWQIPTGPGWWQFRYLILSLFLGTAGISLALYHSPAIRWRPFWKRAGQIALAALAISLVSLVVFPQGWIYFGILHFILVASLISIGLVRFPQVALGLGLAILAIHWLDMLSPRWPFNGISDYLPGYTEDFVPLLPWLGVVFVGVWLGGLVRAQKLPAGGLHLPRWLDFAARHSLAIYLLHQPLLFGLFFLVGKYA